MSALEGGLLRGSLLNGGLLAPVSPILYQPQLWLDASDEDTIAHSSGKVIQWDDKSGNGKHATQGTDADRPITKTRNINGLNVLDFDGANHYLGFTEIDESSGLTMFAVGDVDAAAANGVYVGSSGTGGVSFRSDSSYFIDIVRTGQAVVMGGTVSVRTKTHQLITVATSSAGNQAWLQGVSMESNATDPAYTSGIARIGHADNAGHYNGSIGEILVFNSILSDAIRINIQNYLIRKWRLV